MTRAVGGGAARIAQPAQTSMISADFLSAISLTLASNFLVRDWISSLQVARSSSVRILSDCSWSACLLASRRMLRIATRASSARSLTRSDQLLALLDRQGRDVEPDHLAVGVGRQAQVADLDRLDDVADHRGIERPDQDLLRLGRAQVGELLQRRRRAVIVDPDRVDQPRVRPARPDAPELVGQQARRSSPSGLPPRGRSLRCSWCILCSTLARRNRGCLATNLVGLRPAIVGSSYHAVRISDRSHERGGPADRPSLGHRISRLARGPWAEAPLLTQVPIGSPVTARSMLPSFLN